MTIPNIRNWPTLAHLLIQPKPSLYIFEDNIFDQKNQVQMFTLHGSKRLSEYMTVVKIAFKTLEGSKTRWFRPWPFHPWVGGHLTNLRGSLDHPKKGHHQNGLGMRFKLTSLEWFTRNVVVWVGNIDYNDYAIPLRPTFCTSKWTHGKGRSLLEILSIFWVSKCYISRVKEESRSKQNHCMAPFQGIYISHQTGSSENHLLKSAAWEGIFDRSQEGISKYTWNPFVPCFWVSTLQNKARTKARVINGFQVQHILGGGFKYFWNFHPEPWEMIQFWLRFVKWVGSTTNLWLGGYIASHILPGLRTQSWIPFKNSCKRFGVGSVGGMMIPVKFKF